MVDNRREKELNYPVIVNYDLDGYNYDTVKYKTLIISTYEDNGNMAVILRSEDGEPTDDVTISINIKKLDKPKVFAFNIGSVIVKELIPQLMEQGVIDLDEEFKPIPSGYLEYPVYKLNI